MIFRTYFLQIMINYNPRLRLECQNVDYAVIITYTFDLGDRRYFIITIDLMSQKVLAFRNISPTVDNE